MLRKWECDERLKKNVRDFNVKLNSKKESLEKWCNNKDYIFFSENNSKIFFNYFFFLMK